MTSIERALKRTGGMLPGLPVLRLTLTLVVVAFQSVAVSESFATFVQGPGWLAGPAPFLALFAMLGFTLAQCGARHTPARFLALRALRAAPTLVVAIFGAVFILGPLATSNTIAGYFSDPATWSYLTNLAGWPRFELPGVFEFNNLAFTVDEPLWTVPVYAVVVAATLLSTKFWVGGARVPLAVGAGALGLGALGGGDPLLALGCAAAFAAQCGALAYAWRRRVPSDWRFAAAAAAVLVVASASVGPQWREHPLVLGALAVPAGYCALWASLAALPASRAAVACQPYLLGLLLFSFPLQQLAIQFGPGRQDPLLNLALSLPPVVLLAVASASLFGRVLASWLPPPREIAAPARIAARPRHSVATLAGRAAFWGIFVVLVIVAFALTLIAMGRDPVGV